jgi:hypothetical protein
MDVNDMKYLKRATINSVLVLFNDAHLHVYFTIAVLVRKFYPKFSAGNTACRYFCEYIIKHHNSDTLLQILDTGIIHHFLDLSLEALY